MSEPMTPARLAEIAARHSKPTPELDASKGETFARMLPEGSRVSKETTCINGRPIYTVTLVDERGRMEAQDRLRDASQWLFRTIHDELQSARTDIPALLAEVARLKAERAGMVTREVALEAAIHAWSHGRLRFAGGGDPRFKLNPKHLWKEGVAAPNGNEREYREACECAEVVLARAEAEAGKDGG